VDYPADTAGARTRRSGKMISARGLCDEMKHFLEKEKFDRVYRIDKVKNKSCKSCRIVLLD
jgi:hypothetical protein